MSEQSFSNTQIFSLRHITAVLHLRTLDSTSVLCLGAILNSGINNNNAKNVALSRPRKGHLFILTRLKQEGEVLPCATSAGQRPVGQLKFPSALCMSTKDWEVQQVLILRLQRSFSEYANSQIQSL